MDKPDLKNLKKRYLIWLYKTTKEALDKTERKFTQLDVDRIILVELNKLDKDKKLKNFIEEFASYVQNKEKEGLKLKSLTDYHFLSLKLKAIEKAIIKELGKATLKKIKESYEKEMCKRILEERREKR